MAKRVESVYGDALFELAQEQNRLDDYLEESQIVLAALEENPDLSRMMAHPNITMEDKLQTVEDVFKGRITDELVGLMRMIVEKGHFAKMPEVLRYFIGLAYEEKGIGIVTVTTPIELTDVQKTHVEERLLATTSYASLRMNYEIDASLIGGMVIRIKDRVVDSSVRSKLNELAAQLSRIQLKVGECAS